MRQPPIPMSPPSSGILRQSHYKPLAARRLPTELEREIFRLCAFTRPKTIPKLMLVALRVKEWIEPLMYRVIFLPAVEEGRKSGTSRLDEYPTCTVSRLFRLLEEKPASSFHKSVKHLFIDFPHYGSRHDVIRLLTSCSGVTNLVLGKVWEREISGVGTISMEPHPVLPLLADIQTLQMLSVHIGTLFGDLSPDFTHPMFRNITHLHILDSRSEMSRWSGLSLIPNLTHLAVTRSSVLRICTHLLRSCQKLRYLVYLPALGDDIMAGDPLCVELSGDPRFVAVTCIRLDTDWQVGAHTGENYWTRAEAFVAAKRARKIAPHEYWISGDARKVPSSYVRPSGHYWGTRGCVASIGQAQQLMAWCVCAMAL
ncbi:hypothetical protein C8R44DRAFT_992609 [Mycena epipterygia]|nr:hypothetical protein C8R44DRAFT_992609 [Mycena epipterygia]